jgi:hypothetical protein
MTVSVGATRLGGSIAAEAPRTKHILLAAAIAMNCRTFQFFPGMPFIQELWFGGCSLFLVFIYPFWKTKEHWRFSKFERYLLLLMVIWPVISSFCAWRAYGQPLAYGLAAQRSVALFAFIIAISCAFRYKTLKVSDVEQSLLLLSWGTLILYTTMQLLLRPSDFTSYGIGFVSGLDELAEFKFQTLFVVFGFFYYAFRGFRLGNMKYYVTSLLFLVGSIGKVGGRSLTVSIALTMLILLYRWIGTNFLFKILPKMVMFTVVALLVLYAWNSKALSARYQKFSDAFQVALTGADVEDASAASRKLQTFVALPHIADRPLFGNGLVSNVWQREQDNRVDDFFPSAYFFPADIGLIGVLYLYGVFGILLLGWQCRFAFTAVAGMPYWYHTTLLDATKGLLLFSAFTSISSGTFVFNAEVTLFFIALLGGIRSEFRNCAITPGAVACRE